ncbi:Pyridoxal phosphate homeostasis protein-like protein [Drosera capensis]
MASAQFGSFKASLIILGSISDIKQADRHSPLVALLVCTGASLSPMMLSCGLSKTLTVDELCYLKEQYAHIEAVKLTEDAISRDELTTRLSLLSSPLLLTPVGACENDHTFAPLFFARFSNGCTKPTQPKKPNNDKGVTNLAHLRRRCPPPPQQHLSDRSSTGRAKPRRDPDQVKVVAVSKTKPVAVLRQVYDAGHRIFGENYVQELIEKAPQLPDDIEWHFIGNLQSNKVKPLLCIELSLSGSLVLIDVIYAGVPNLAMVESVEDEKIANHLDRVAGTLGRKPLKVLVQVNTSGEISKSGVEPSGCVALAKHVTTSCPNLEFSGLMTIGMLDYTSTPENFKTLVNCRADVCKALGISEEQCELSMGMSADFEQAIEMGSTIVRVGSTIFGAREYNKKQSS